MRNRTLKFISWIALIAMVSWSPFVEAQVSIKERVSLNPDYRGKLHTTSSPPPYYVIAPHDGTMQVIFNLAYKIYSRTPPTAYVTVTLPDTVYTTNIWQYFNDSTSFWVSNIDTCQHASAGYMKYSEFCHNTEPLNALLMRHVTAGDTIRFLYHGTVDNPVDGVSFYTGFPYPDTTWVVLMETWPANVNCWSVPSASECCQVDLRYAKETVKFSRLDSNNVYPTYSGHNNTTDKKNYMDLQVSTRIGSAPEPNVLVRVSRSALVDSGGHSHDANRPLGRYLITGTDTLDSFERSTDGTGSLKFKFIASQFGGVERIKVALSSDSTKIDTVSLVTEVKLLYDFGLVDIPYWELTGNSGQTWVGACPGTIIRHYSNHWFDSAYVGRLATALVNFWTWSGTSEGGGSYLLLQINDMSLHYGGLFDICSNWNTPHTSHRIGRSVDIDSSRVRLANGGQYISLSGYQVGMLTQFMVNRGGSRGNEPSIHYDFGIRRKR